MIKDGNFITIQSFMRTELGLKGNDLLVYAVIYGFSQTDDQWFTGSIKYLEEWSGTTKMTILNTLKNLVNKGLIIKKEEYINGVKFCKYKQNYTSGKEIIPEGGKKIIPEGGKKIIPNNIDNNNINNNIDKNKKKSKEIENLIDTYTDNQELKETLLEFVNFRKEIKKPMTTQAMKRLLNKLDKLAAEDDKKIKILENSIIHNWQDIYQLKENEGYTPVNLSHIKRQNDTKKDIDESYFDW